MCEGSKIEERINLWNWMKRSVILFGGKFFHSEALTSLPLFLCEGLKKLIMDRLPFKENCFQFPRIKAVLLLSGFLISTDSRIFYLQPDFSTSSVTVRRRLFISCISGARELQAAPTNWLNNLFALDGSWSSIRLSTGDNRPTWINLICVLNVTDFCFFVFFAHLQIQDFYFFGNENKKTSAYPQP